MNHLRIFLFSFILVASVACKKDSDSDSDPTPADYGSWSYSGKTYKGVFATWTTGLNAFQGLADEPNTSGLQFYFSSSNPSGGTYTIVPFGGPTPTSCQVQVAVVDNLLPGITYTTGSTSSGTATVSRSGDKVTVSVSNIKLIAVLPTSPVQLDSIYASGTIHN